MLFVCDIEGFALTFEDDHILRRINVFDMMQLQKLKAPITVCKLEIHGNVVICHSLPENQGRSIVNMAETLALAASYEFNIDASQLVWIEHHTPKAYESLGESRERWDRVLFRIIENADDGYEFDKPEWKEITEQEVKLLISG